MTDKVTDIKFKNLCVFVMLFCFAAQTAAAVSPEMAVTAVDSQQAHLSSSSMAEKSGRVLVLFSHPALPNKLWAGTEHGGLWQSGDSGSTWMPVGAVMQNLPVRSIAADSRNPNIMYAGTGDGRRNEISQRGQGMFMSDDGGASWSLLSLTNPAIVGDNWSHINSITINTNNVILAATSDNQHNGFIYRSVDGGRTWGLTPVYIASKVGPHNVIHKVRFDPDNPNAAIFMDDYANVTHTSDGGQTWRVVKTSSTSCK